jgi:hypothetical protein
VTKRRSQADFEIETAGNTWVVSIFIFVTPSLSVLSLAVH